MSSGYIATPMRARDILALSLDEVWRIEDQYGPSMKFPLQFDDVVMEVTAPYTIISRYLWELHRLYPETPLLSTHHLGSTTFTSGAITSFESRIVESINELYDGRIDYDQLAMQIYQLNNLIHNMIVSKLSRFVESSSAKDYIEVLHHPEVQAAKQKCLADPSARAIKELYNEIPEIISKPGFLHGNGLISTMKTKNTSMGQVLQCIGVRGYTTDINSAMFKDPILSSYGEGLTNLLDFIKESRSASKALLFQKDPIRETEYFNRRLQLLNQSIRYIGDADCGTVATINWQVRPGDIKVLEGKYYYDEQGILRCITQNDARSKSLAGKTIRMRTPLHCKLIGSGGICLRCLGRLAAGIPAGTNIGHVAAAYMGEKSTQPVLSVKHLDNSTEIKAIDLDRNDLKYVRLGKERNELIYLNEKEAVKGGYLVLPVDDVFNLTQAMATEDLSGLSIYKISALESVGIRYTEDDVEAMDWVNVSGPSRLSSLTQSFLEYVKEVGYEQVSTKFIEIPLRDWDFTKPFLKLPQKQINMLDFMKQFSNIIECDENKGAKKGLDPSKDEDLVTYLSRLSDFASQHIHIPLMYLEITTLAVLVQSNEEMDYRLSTDSSRREFSSASTVMKSRSIGAALAYEEQAEVLMGTHTFNRHHRVSHPMDSLFYRNGDNSIYNNWDKY